MNKVETKMIDGKKVIFRYPTIANEIQIKTDLLTTTGGQYTMMKISPDPDFIEASDLVLKTCTLASVARIDGETTFDWFNQDIEKRDFINECYEAYMKWRDSFRSKDEKSNPK